MIPDTPLITVITNPAYYPHNPFVTLKVYLPIGIPSLLTEIGIYYDDIFC